MNKKKILLTSLFTTSALSTVGFVQLSKELSNSSSINLSNTSLNATSTTIASGLENISSNTNYNKQVSLPNSYYQQNSLENLSNDNGPILLFDNARTFGATDWYGNPAWYISLNSTNAAIDGYYSASWFSTSTSSAIDFSKAGTKVVDWAYNHQTDNLYVLTDKSYLIIVSSKTGEIISTSAVNNNVNKIQIIDFNSSVYLWNSKAQNPTIYSIEPQTGKVNSTTITSTDLSSKYLFALIPLDVNYSIAITSTTQINDTASSNPSFELIFVDDNLKKISNSNIQSVSLIGNLKASDIYVNQFKRSSDYVVFIYNKIYSVSLNKSSMGSSKFTDLLQSSSNSSLGSFTAPTNGVNSAFIDANNQIYFKTNESKDITSLSISNAFNNLQINTTSLGQVFNNKESSAKSSQIFAVPNSTTGEEVISQGYTGFLLSPTDFTGTGFLNGSLLTSQLTSQSNGPAFTISASSSNVASGINASNIARNNSVSNVTLETSNATLIADDLTGSLFVKVPYTFTGAWYGNGSASINSRGYLIGKFQYTNITTATTWADQSSFSNLFGSYEPSQITVDMLKKQATSIIKIPQSILSLSNNELDINFIIKSTVASTGKIKLSATIKYKNAYGSIVSYSMSLDKEYTVKKEAANYAFLFAGENDNSSDKTKVNKSDLSISELISKAQNAVANGSDEFLTVSVGALSSDAIISAYANVLPSLWSTDVINSSFIVKNDKYPSNPTITLIPDDTNGNIIVIVKYDNLSNSTASKFAIRYTGITSYAKSSIKFQGSDMTINKANGDAVFPGENILNITKVNGFSDYGTKLVSSLDVNSLSSLYSSSLITNMGFEPTVTFVDSKTNGKEGLNSLDQEYGSFLLKIDFTNSVSKFLKNAKDEFIPFSQTDFANKMGLENGVVYQRYGGLLPIGSTYNISLNKTGTNYKSLIANNNVNASLSSEELLSILTINGYDTSKGDTITILGFQWNGEVLQFKLHAQSKTYESINTTQTFNVSWSPKFASVRNMSLSVAVATSIVGITLVSLGVSIYIIRRNKIRKLLK